MEKYHVSSVIKGFVFLIWKKGCIRCISLQVNNNIGSGSVESRYFVLSEFDPLRF